MSAEEFKTSILDLVNQKPDNWRTGQAVFNYTEKLYGDIAREAQFMYNVDCFYDDSEISRFLDVCYKIYKEREN